MSKTSSDPIADMLTRIRNAIMVNKSEVSVPHSAIKESVARLLQENDFIDSVEVVNDDTHKALNVRICSDNTRSRITEIVRLSKPGRRHYASANEIPVVKRGRGVVIVSTSKGLMTGSRAKSEHIGGELICKVY